jgi:hypothetical protein
VFYIDRMCPLQIACVLSAVGAALEEEEEEEEGIRSLCDLCVELCEGPIEGSIVLN